MPKPKPRANPNRPPVTAQDLIRKAVAATGRRARTKALAILARRSAREGAAGIVFRLLVATGPTGTKLALEFFGRLPGQPPAELAGPVVSLLKQNAGSARVRIAAVGNLLAITPDTVDAVRPVLSLLTAGLSRSPTLERLIRLQSRVIRCDTLDRIVAATEMATPLKCPKCQVKMTRAALIQHLWQKHKLVWRRGKVRSPQALLEKTMERGAKAAGRGPRRIDSAFRQTALYFPDVPPRQVFQALAARGSAHPTQLEPLLARAAEDRCGVCPACLSAIPDPVPELPAPAPVGGGRLAAEGYAVDVRDAPTGRTVIVTTRDGTTVDAGRRVAPRMFGVYVGGSFLLAAAGAAGFLAPRLAVPVGGALAAAGWLSYAALRFLRKGLPDPRDEAVDRAWSDVVPGIGRKMPAVRFLVRLARASLGTGNPVDRTPAVWELVEQAAVLADRGGVHLQLLATTRILQVCDGATAGRERVAGLLKVFEPFVRGELPLAYAEAAAETLLSAPVLPSGEAGRLAVLLIGAAFDSGFLPSDLAAVVRFSPWVRALLREPTDPHLRALYAVWRGRHQRRWNDVGPAETVFELAERSPAAAKKVLAVYPDALLMAETDDAVEREIGVTLVCTGGVVAGGATVADPDAIVQLSANGRELQFGSHRIGLDRKLPNRVALAIRGWAKYRGRVLLPTADQPEPRQPGQPKWVGVLSPLAVTCPLCSAVSVVRTGQLGVKWEDLAAGRG